MPYIAAGILPDNPFATIDPEGVGELMRIAVEKARRVKPGLECGICGEHGGDPNSIALCHKLGLDYVSCSPFRVPIARLAAAHAALKETGRRNDLGAIRASSSGKALPADAEDQACDRSTDDMRDTQAATLPRASCPEPGSSRRRPSRDGSRMQPS